MSSSTKKKPSLAITYAVFIFVAVISLLFFALNILLLIQGYISGGSRALYEQGVFITIVFFILYGNVVYFLTRIGQLKRDRAHRAPSHKKVDQLLRAAHYPTVTILVPSYKEDSEIILMTVLSVIMQPYPGKKIALLIDDPPNLSNHEDAQFLEAARRIPLSVQALLKPLVKACQRKSAPQIKNALAELFVSVEKQLHHNNQCTFFISVLRKTINKYIRAINSNVPESMMADLGHLLDFELVVFERKQFENLSHEPNKAMNLNSYIALMGRRFVVAERNGKKYIEENASGPLHIPDTDFVLTLDADSMLLPDYIPKLMHYALSPGNERMAVVQTPYSAFPNISAKLEHVAGITTDIQYLIHQGFTYYQATYWVGANALIRKAALEDIKHAFVERGFTMFRYVHDRTVIEDTESSIDLLVKGWKLYNYPERLAYSATPPDFGSLIVQRRRWANGGIIIFPKLVKYFLGRWYKEGALMEFFVRSHYLVSIAGVNIGLLALIFYPFNQGVHYISLVILASVPYFIFYTIDLGRIGYQWGDIFKVYSLNLLLIPVNIGGVTKSIHQGVTMKKIPFGRTPKINDRTAIPIFYILFELLLLGYLLFASVIDIFYARWLHAIFSAVNSIFFLYAFHVFLGFGNIFSDIMARAKKLRIYFIEEAMKRNTKGS